jgi:BASS family bile acid:Na+ symporter
MLEKAVGFYTRFMAGWVVLFGVAAYFFPGPFLALKPYNMRFFALTMFGIGAVLSAEDFARIAKKPIIVLIGSCSQFTIMPLGAFLIARILGLGPEITLGLILTGSAPGAMASNVMSYVAKADTAYSVSLTTVSTLLCPVLTPGLTYLLARQSLDVPFVDMFLSLLLTVVAPIFVGFSVRHFLKRRIEKILPIFPAISVTFIIFICSLVIAANGEDIFRATAVVLAAVVVLNVYGMSAGYGVGRLFGMETRRKRTLAIEIGMQNAGLGTALAMEHFSERVAMPAAFFVFVCIITAAIAAAFWQRQDGGGSPER